MIQNIIQDHWRRPQLAKSAGSEIKTIVFQQVDIDHYEAPNLAHPPSNRANRSAAIRIFGVTCDGNSILCHVHGYQQYFYLRILEEPDFTKLEDFRESVNEILWARGPSETNLEPAKELVTKIAYAPSRTIQGQYVEEAERHFLKISVASPELLASVTSVFSEGLAVYPDVCSSVDCKLNNIYEQNIDYVTRFMCDLDISGCCWIELTAGTYQQRAPDNCQSHCQLECDINYKHLFAYPTCGDWMDTAPLRRLSFDIECKVRREIFPQPKRDSVIQISNVVDTYRGGGPFCQCVFTLNSCAPIEGAAILSFDREEDLLLAWSRFVLAVDPDIITGYNIEHFDLNYLIKRAAHLKVIEFPYLGRMKCTKSQVEIMTARKRDRILRKNKISIPGRVQFDLMVILRRDLRELESFKLNFVANHFLHEQKEDVHFTQITPLFNGDANTRRKLALYCLKDSQLVTRLTDKLMILGNYIIGAMRTGVLLRDLVTTGFEANFELVTLREARKLNQIIPNLMTTTNYSDRDHNNNNNNDTIEKKVSSSSYYRLLSANECYISSKKRKIS